MINRKLASFGMGLAAVLGLAVAVPAFAQTATVSASVTGGVPTSAPAGGWQSKAGMARRGGMMMGKPAVFGTVSAINGTSLTIAGKSMPARPAPGSASTVAPVAPVATTYTVDASSATIKKDNATSTLSAVAVGDTVMVQGTVTGTNVVATMVRDGVMVRTPGMMPNGNGKGGQGRGMASSTAPITGNGQPVIAGTLSAVNGSSLTVTTKSNVSYAVDASSAKIVQGKSTITASSLTVGDSVIVQGAINGTSVTASSIIDQKAPSASTSGSGTAKPGVLHGIGSFFKHLFGF